MAGAKRQGWGHAWAGVVCLLVCAWAQEAQAQCAFQMDFIDVGQGDATFVRTPDCKTLLVDGGDQGSGVAIRAHLARLGVTRVDVGLVSHYHQDHLAGFVELAQAPAIPVAALYDRGGTYDSGTYRDYATLYAGKRATPTLHQVIPLGAHVSLRVVAVNGNGLSPVDENGRSLGVVLTYGALNVLLAGDAGGIDYNVESRLAPHVGPVDVYHVDHHGSANSSTPWLLAHLRPTASVISCGLNNAYGHPNASVLDRLYQEGDVWLTADPAQQVRHGTISLFSDGATFRVEQDGSSGQYSARADASDPVREVASVTVYRGSSTTAGVSALATDDNSLWRTTSTLSGSSYKTDWAARFQVPERAPRKAWVAFQGKFSVSRTMTVSAFAPAENAWVTLGTATVGSTEGTWRWELPTPSRFRATNGDILVRFAGNTRSTSYTHHTDAAVLLWEP